MRTKEEEQRQLGYLAYLVNGLDNSTRDKECTKGMSQSWYDHQQAKIDDWQEKVKHYTHALYVMNYSYEQVEAIVLDKIFTGLRNYNRMESISFYE